MSNRRIERKKRRRTAEEKLLDVIFRDWPEERLQESEQGLVELRRSIKFRIGQEKAKCKLRAIERRAKRNGKE
jgi:hypothetical protein